MEGSVCRLAQLDHTLLQIYTSSIVCVVRVSYVTNTHADSAAATA